MATEEVVEVTARTRRAASFDVAFEELAELLHLPEGATIVCISTDSFRQEFARTFRVFVEHEQLKEVNQGEPIPMICPIWRMIAEEGQREVVFQAWGQEGE